MTQQPLLIALVSVQFLVHALGWAMTAQLTGRWRAVEGQFALSWGLLACGLMLYVPPWAAGSLPRDVGDLMIIGSMAMQHRGLTLYWGLQPDARRYAALAVFACSMLAVSFFLANGHGVRVANVCIGAGLMLAASTRLLWRQGRPSNPVFATVVAASYGLLSIALAARAVQALTVPPTTKISIDAPGHANIPFAILVMFVGGMINLVHIRLVLGRVMAQLRAQARTDPLTGVLNRRGLLLQLNAWHAEARREGRGYAVLMVDADHFKSINDTHGHDEGDRVLQRLAQAMRDSLGADAAIGRWGGEEFCAVLPRASADEARSAAQQVTARVAGIAGPVRLTVSVGVAVAREDTAGPDEVIRQADQALYLAKVGGRNRVVAAGQALAVATAVRAEQSTD
jgi:diguanylate cyclase (GGDEF)-like protein